MSARDEKRSSRQRPSKPGGLALGAMLLALVLASCATLTPEEERFVREYDLDRPSGRTARYGAKVVFPDWLMPCDRKSVLAMVDSNLSILEEIVPWAREAFDFSDLTVVIHNALDCCVSGPPPIWVKGWRSADMVFVCWRSIRKDGRRVGLAEKNCLPSLVHEVLHILGHERDGDPDLSHSTHFRTPRFRAAQTAAKALSRGVELSADTVRAALAFRYRPWAVPLDDEKHQDNPLVLLHRRR